MPRAQENRALNEFLGLILLGLGTLLFLALISYEPRQVPAWFPLSRYSAGSNFGSTNFIGPLGAIIACCFYFLIGAASYLAAATLLGYGGALLLSVTQPPTKRLLWIGTFIVTGAGLLALQPWFLKDWPRFTHAVAVTGNSSSWIGGWAGYRLVDKDHGLLRNTMGFIGSSILLVCLYFSSLIMMTGIHPIRLLREALTIPSKFLEKYYAYRLARASERGRLDIEQKRMERQARKLEKELTKKGYPTPKAEPGAEEDDEEIINRPAPKVIDTSIATPKKVDPKGKKDKIVPLEQVNFDNYVLPSIELLEHQDLEGRPAADPEELLKIQATLIDTLAQFGISVAAGDITKGPTITRYEVYPAKGVRVDKIVSLERDIARATRAERINILAPIPGKDTVGIEIANTRKVKVTLRELMESEDFAQSKAKIPLALGKDVYGKTIIGDLAAMPHCLVAGTTGSGKSVCINSIIASMLYKFTPEEIRFIMIDPKVVEMQVYNTLPHLVIPVVTDPKKVLLALRWVIDEMEKRYKIFAKTNVRNITSFNARPKAKSQAELDAEKNEKDRQKKAAKPVEVIDFNELSDDDLITDEPEPDLEPIRVQRDDEIIVPENMPYIVVIVDELADLMQTAPADVESAIARITQMARAAGIHMIVATQTPRADVVTGVIKANIPTRIAFQVASGLDSRIILDEKGAERLLGQGDMLYLPPGTSRMTRAQGVLVTDEEIHRLVDFVSKQSAPVFESSIHDKMQSSGGQADDVTEEDEELVQKCLEIMRQEKKASTSLFQRRLRLGYTRAARVVDILEQRGYVAPGEGAKPREILKDLDTLPF